MKYIINVEDEPLVRKSPLYGETAVYKASGFKSLVFDRNGLNKLTPYDEEEIRKAYYQKGLDDAWECARKINCIPSDGGMSGIELDDIFNMDNNCTIMKIFSASEAIEKIKAHEEGQDKIRVGDEVVYHDGIKAIVLDEVVNDAWIVFTENECAEEWHVESFKKTGRHFDQIVEVLKKMRGEE